MLIDPFDIILAQIQIKDLCKEKKNSNYKAFVNV